MLFGVTTDFFSGIGPDWSKYNPILIMQVIGSVICQSGQIWPMREEERFEANFWKSSP